MCLEIIIIREGQRERGRERESNRPIIDVFALSLFFSRCKAWSVKLLSSNIILRFGKIMIVKSNLGSI